MKQEAHTKGFTLIELLVVIAIISVLSSIILVALNTSREKGYDAQRLTNLRSIQTALSLYAADHEGRYPSSTNGTCWGGWNGQTSCVGNLAPNDVIPGLVPDYLPQFPTDPEINIPSNSCDYFYRSNGIDYKLLFHACLSSVACEGPNIPSTFYDPDRPGWACAVQSSPAATWW